MMMTSGAKVHYKSMFDAASQIVAAEGVKSLFKGAGANILRGVAGAGVLSLYVSSLDVLQSHGSFLTLFRTRCRSLSSARSTAAARDKRLANPLVIHNLLPLRIVSFSPISTGDVPVGYADMLRRTPNPAALTLLFGLSACLWD
jgi:hypothetical protein